MSAYRGLDDVAIRHAAQALATDAAVTLADRYITVRDLGIVQTLGESIAALALDIRKAARVDAANIARSMDGPEIAEEILRPRPSESASSRPLDPIAPPLAYSRPECALVMCPEASACSAAGRCAAPAG